MKPTAHGEISSACLSRHPAVAHLFLVRPMTKRTVLYIVIALNVLYITALAICAFVIGHLHPPGLPSHAKQDRSIFFVGGSTSSRFACYLSHRICRQSHWGFTRGRRLPDRVRHHIGRYELARFMFRHATHFASMTHSLTMRWSERRTALRSHLR